MSESVLLDFLYADHERVASFLAQLLGSGSPTESERTGSKGKTSTRKAGLSLGPISAGLEGERDVSLEVRETYDPLWSNSRRLIETVSGQGSAFTGIKPDVEQIRIFSGNLLCFDYSLISRVMSAQAVDNLIAAGVSDNDVPTKKPNAAQRQEKKHLASVIREFITSLPLGIGFVMVADDYHFWFNVKRKYLSLQDLDIPLKFPVHISGKWNVLGVVDALPHDHVEGIQPVLDKNIDGLVSPMVLHFIQVTGFMTAQFGRPIAAWGLSPLIVYREVAVPPSGA
ncbi:MAG: hypothetical protein JSS55_00010 [Proteobacteria bacterium]|nr:hypothetical protein [Pseudomonadota bacterium]